MKVRPKVKSTGTPTRYDDADFGEVFTFVGSSGLWIKCGEGDDNQTAVNLETGMLLIDNWGSAIVLVDATLNWKHIPVKKTKKGKK